MKYLVQLAVIGVSLAAMLVEAASFNDYNNNNNNNINNNTDDYNRYNRIDTNDNNRYDNNNDHDSNGYPPRRHKHHCQTERMEHPVMMKKFKDNSGYWVIYTQVIETRNVANHCHRNEYIYLAHRQKAGWLWDPKINSLVQYSLGEPKFVSRRVRHPNRHHHTVIVNMSQNYAPAAVDYDRVFPERLAKEISRVGSDNGKWSTLAMQSLPALQLDTAYFQTVLAKENNGSQPLKVINESIPSQDVYE